jgi:FixJ family two-component response regulator
MRAEKNLVVVVDDDRAVRDALKFALELDGLAVLACDSGAQLLQSPELERTDCLVLDHKMPGMDGFAVIAALAARKIDLPIIIITAPVTEALRWRAEQAGVTHVLEKPLLDNVLLEEVRKTL